jgi:hypothetical protein
MNDLNGNPLELMKAEPYSVIMNWRSSNLKCDKCGITSRVKYARDGKTYCQACVNP